MSVGEGDFQWTWTAWVIYEYALESIVHIRETSANLHSAGTWTEVRLENIIIPRKSSEWNTSLFRLEFSSKKTDSLWHEMMKTLERIGKKLEYSWVTSKKINHVLKLE